MFYSSEMPRVVGEFDAESLHQKIDSVAPPDVSMYSQRVVSAICRAEGLDRLTSIEDIAQIKWKFLFRPNTFRSLTIDGQVNYIEQIRNFAGDSLADELHPDDAPFNRIFQLPEVLTTASRWPTSFLIGNISLRPRHIPQLSTRFWSTNLGKEAIKNALEKGDVHEHKFNEGEVVVAPSGTLHRRDIPKGATGYRYFMRHFPNIDMLHSDTVLSRLRVFH